MDLRTVNGERPRVLVVDDERGLRELIRDALAAEGYDVALAPHGAAALDLMRRFTPDVIVLDLRMPIMDGWSFLRFYRERSGSRAAVIVLTGVHGAPPGLEAEAVLRKPFAIDDLVTLVHGQVRPKLTAQ